MTIHHEPMPKWLEDELGLVKPDQPKPVKKTEPERHPPIDKWWERGEECPH